MTKPENIPENFLFRKIGVIHSPFTSPVGMPIQPGGAEGVQGKIEIQDEFLEGLTDLEQFSRIILLYPFHKSQGYSLQVTPFLDTRKHGVFATRAPRRPNAIGISIVKMLGIEGNVIHVEGIDVLDGTPLLDIKPYVPEFDAYPDAIAGWFTECKNSVSEFRSDDRFQETDN